METYIAERIKCDRSYIYTQEWNAETAIAIPTFRYIHVQKPAQKYYILVINPSENKRNQIKFPTFAEN